MLLAFPLASAQAADVQVDYYQKKFYLDMQFRSSLDEQEIHRRLSDFNHLERVNRSIVQSHIVGSAGEGKTLVWKRIKGCVAFYCRDLEHTELVTQKKNSLIMVTIPEKSDFELGAARWVVMPAPLGTGVMYSATLKPSFALPPLLGSWLMKRALERELRRTAAALGDVETEE